MNLNIKSDFHRDITVIGAAVVDVLAEGVSSAVFQTGSQPVREIRLSFGGDALNEAAALARMGKRAELITRLGWDSAGDQILDYMRKEGLPVDKIKREEGIETSVNLVLVDDKGERFFLTNPQASLRRLSEADIEPWLETAADIVSFASMFVSPQLDIPAMYRIFRKVKEKPERVLAVDMTKAKNGEKFRDIKELLPYIDYIFPNEEEIALLTGEKDPYKNAGYLIDGGVSCAVIKCGGRGCLLRTAEDCCRIPAYPVERVRDTTGAGDCFAAGFLWGLSQKMPLRECGRFACAAASCSVECLGAVEGLSSLEKPVKRYREMASGKIPPQMDKTV
ncbi:MAG: carbohydrate kinase family protein [Clostridiales bacterium]|nr:carbohydrate kinase family protein [Clostridiales bacterium]